jgi:hypothetical protein
MVAVGDFANADAMACNVARIVRVHLDEHEARR